jgi:hypothetical protein
MAYQDYLNPIIFSHYILHNTTENPTQLYYN